MAVAVVGSGPSAVYVVQELLRKTDTTIDVFERLPTPFGLLRYGVAPDHPKIKSLIGSYSTILSDDRVRFIGNVEVGRDISVAELHELYHAVVIAVGAPRDRRLSIPGEDLPGCVASGDFVGWYNGHPAAPILFDGNAHRAVVVGLGNVALDVARILARPAADLEITDMPEEVLGTLRASRITDVHLVGRGGPERLKFTSKELRETGDTEGLDIVVHHDVPEDEELEGSLADDVNLKRCLAMLREWRQTPRIGAQRRLHLHFGYEPTEFVGDERVTKVLFATGAPGQDDRGTADLDADLVVTCLGYRSTALPELPFDEERGVIPNVAGRIVHDGVPAPDEFVVGWAKRGATGVVGTNRADAIETVTEMLTDEQPAEPSQVPLEALTALLNERSVTPVLWAGWRSIEQAEAALGATFGRTTTKIPHWAGLLGAAGQ